jgi:uncharacterized membrane protein AbrB (regulator of aidB expression)
MAVLKPLALALNWIIRLVIMGGMFLVAVPVALVLGLCGMPAPVIIGAMGACGVVGAWCGLRATVPRRGSSPGRLPLRPKRAPKTR